MLGKKGKNMFVLLPAHHRTYLIDIPIKTFLSTKVEVNSARQLFFNANYFTYLEADSQNLLRQDLNKMLKKAEK